MVFSLFFITLRAQTLIQTRRHTYLYERIHMHVTYT